MIENRKKVVVKLDGGLGNRLRALISAMYLSDRFDFSMLLDWTPSKSCECNFHDLFDNDIETFSKPKNLGRKEFYKSILSGPINYYGRNCMEDADLARLAIMPEQLSDIHDDAHIVYDSPNILKFIGRRNRAKILNSLIINRDILSTAEDFCAQHRIDRQTYGVHVRRTDAVRRDDDFYTVKMDAIISRDPLARFFVCSDSKETEKDMARRYPGRVIIKSKKSYVKKRNDDMNWAFRDTNDIEYYNVYRDKRSVLESLEDIIILTRTTFSIRSNGSFSDIVEWWNPKFKHTCRTWGIYKSKNTALGPDTWVDHYLKNLQNSRVRYNMVRLEPFSSNGGVKDGISIITACQDRLEQLKESLKSWCACSEITEIIIVDWSSKEPISEWIQNFDDSRIKLIRVDGQERWVLTHAFNLAARFASCKQLCKMDADFRVSADFFKHHCLEPRVFYSGDQRQARNINEKHLNGFLFLDRDEFFRVNGYNERILTYGWDDSDIYNRLTKSGLVRKTINNELIEHIQHGDAERAAHFGSVDLARAIQANKRLCKKKPWGPSDLVTHYRTEHISKHYIHCTPVSEVRQVNANSADHSLGNR